MSTQSARIDNYVPLRRPFRPLPPQSALGPTDEGSRPEPPNGVSREEWIKGQLKGAYRRIFDGAMNGPEDSVTGCALADRFVDWLDLRRWVAYNTLTRTQRRILFLLYGPQPEGAAERTIQDVAALLSLRRWEVSALRHDALEYLCRDYWDDPAYVMPWRTSYGQRVRDALGY